jgi:hypothetical protein
MKKTLLALSFVIAANVVHAQSATPGSRYAWDQPASTLAEASSYTYRVYNDGSATGTNIAGVTCTGGTSPFQCSAPIGLYTPGGHTANITAVNATGESLHSNVFSFVMVLVPAAPLNFRAQ